MEVDYTEIRIPMIFYMNFNRQTTRNRVCMNVFTLAVAIDIIKRNQEDRFNENSNYR
jgi:hypothetical protein